jgi:hypothetical protein
MGLFLSINYRHIVKSLTRKGVLQVRTAPECAPNKIYHDFTKVIAGEQVAALQAQRVASDGGAALLERIAASAATVSGYRAPDLSAYHSQQGGQEEEEEAALLHADGTEGGGEATGWTLTGVKKQSFSSAVFLMTVDQLPRQARGTDQEDSTTSVLSRRRGQLHCDSQRQQPYRCWPDSRSSRG